jgi:hypothetical protein
MNKNLGTADKAIRIFIAFVIAALYLMNVISGILAIMFGILAVVFVLTSFIGFCPLYSPFGINTSKK